MNQFLCALCVLCGLNLIAAPLQWTCDWPEAKSQTFSLYQGETATFEPTFRVNGRTVTNATIEAVWYQTNGMGNAWWKLDGATFAPSNDVGAAAYRFFVEASVPGSPFPVPQTIYRANGALRMLPSPGFEPSTVQLPARSLDFAAIDYSNAPWPAEIEGATNSLSASLSSLVSRVSQAATNYTDSAISAAGSVTPSMVTNIVNDIAPTPGNYAAVSNAAMSAAAATNDFLRTTGGTITGELAIGPNPNNSAKFETDPSGAMSLELHDSIGNKLYITGGRLFYQRYDWQGGVELYFPPTDGTLALDGDVAAAATAATNYTDSATNSLSASLSSQLSRVSRDATNYTDSAISTVSAEIEPAVTAYPRVYAFMTGSTNANFVVTNYQLTAEADAERTHFDPADPDLDFSTVPSSLRLEDFSTGTNRVVVDTRDWTVWYYACKIGSAIHTAYTNAVETCRAWVNFTASGLENPIPDTLVIDVPNIWLMAGKTFEKHVASSNACWVIRSNGVTMPISDNAQSAGGFLELTDAFGTPYIRFNKTESYFVDPAADGIEYDKATGAWLVTYSTASKPKGGANAVIEGSTTYPGKAILKAEDDADCPATITWTGSANNWVMHAVPKPIDGAVPKSMFFGAVVEVQGQDYIEYLRPMSIPHLLVDGVKIAPDIPASHPVGTVVPWKVVQ